MLGFLFGRRPKAVEPVVETQREELERLVQELNAAMAVLPQKPRLLIDLATGGLELDLPETLPDEALALPAPRTDDSDGKGDADAETQSAA